VKSPVYRTNPAWQRAQAALINPGTGSAAMRMMQSIEAAIVMRGIEHPYDSLRTGGDVA
jgi:hypothetical protein